MRAILAVGSLLCAAGCAGEDPLTRSGQWHPIGANDANLRAMIADPDDLVTGVASRTADGQVVAAAVARYRSGRVKDLPDVTISKVAPIQVNNAAPAAAPAAGE